MRRNLDRRSLPVWVILLSLLIVSALIPTSPAAAADGPRQVYRITGTIAADNQILIDLGFDVAAVRPGEWTDIVASPDDVARLQRLGYEPVQNGTLQVTIPAEYHTYAETLTALQQMVAAHPTIARLEDIGEGWGKIYNNANYASHDIWALKISDNVNVDEPEPEILYTGVHHAREPMGDEVCLGIASALLNGYGSDINITRYVNEHETWIVPLVNPDGHWCVTDLNYTDWRKNVRDNDGNGHPTAPGFNQPDGVDNNRNYGKAWGGDGSSNNPGDQVYCGPSAFSEPENQAMRDLALRENFAFSIDYHTYGEEILYVYGFDNTTHAPDEATIIPIASTLRDKIGGNYIYEQANQLYPAAGNSQDWHYAQYNSFAFIIEMATQFIPPGSAISGIVAANLRGALYLQDRVDGAGVRGIVRLNGVPGLATVHLLGVDDPTRSNPRHTHPVTGDYYRITLPGQHTLVFSADGFADQQFVVNVPTNTYVTLDVNFQNPEAVGDGGAIASDLSLNVTPNPAQGQAGLQYALPAGATSADLAIYDLTGREVSRQSVTGAHGLTYWDGGGPNGKHLPAGIYLARITAGEKQVTKRLVMLP
jgi:hypothetical protein